MTTTTEIPGTAHHTYGPSTLKSRAICPGWQNDNSSDKEHADEGTLLHEVSEKKKASEVPAIKELTDEQKDCVITCLRYVERLEEGALEVKKEVRLSILDGLTFGTSDRVIVRKATKGRRIDVVDFKFGRRSVDDAATNLQGFAYVLGAFDLYQDAETATVHFILPRRDEVDTHTFTRADYAKLALAVKTVIERAATYQQTKDASMLNMTPSNCLYCGNKIHCPKATDFSLAVVRKYAPLEVVDDVHSSTITDPAKMAKLYDAAKVMEKFVDSVKKHALDMALANGGTLWDETGKAVYQITERDGSRKIKDLGLAIPVLSKHLDDREILSVADVSLTGVLKLISAKAPRGKKSEVIGSVEKELFAAEALTQSAGTRFLKRVTE